MNVANYSDAVEAHIYVDIVVKFTDEQYTTINQSTAGRFYPRVFVNCLQVTKSLVSSWQRPSGWNVLQLID